MNKLKQVLMGDRVGGTRVVPVTVKIVIVFTLMILVSNFTSNYINLIYNGGELENLMRRLLSKELQDIHAFSNNQFEILKFNNDRAAAIKAIENKSLFELKNSRAFVLGVNTDGKVIFQSSKIKKRFGTLEDKNALGKMNERRIKKILNGDLQELAFNGQEYFAVYKFNESWDVFLIRGEERDQFYENQRKIYRNISIIIIIITLASALMGIFLLRHVLRFITVITHHIMNMVQTQRLEIIDLKNAPNDDITYMGMAFNSLSGTINNLVGIFRKFVNQDIVVKAYRDRKVDLEGKPQNLTILFSDIKSFTNITETLGTDIIKLLNLYYDRSIRDVINHDGIIGAIIGDALLAVYGAMEHDNGQIVNENKSYQAILSGYKIQETARDLRKDMRKIKESAILDHNGLTPTEAAVYKAVQLQVGVGIDGGEVFYGTIGSFVRMTNTVIGDNVNAASRLEGLTRIYKVPLICSEYVKNDVEENRPHHGFDFIEIDTVQVKGKTVGKKIYWPLPHKYRTQRILRDVELFSQGLELYYKGDWARAHEFFSQGQTMLAKLFTERTESKKSPSDWNGIWEMKTK